MKKIIVPTDFSPVALNALNYAADMAIAINAELLIVNVYNIPVSYTEVPVVMISVEEMKKSSNNQLTELQKNILHITSGKIKVDIESRMGDTVDELEDICNTINPFAVIMGAKGKSGLENLLYGSTTLTAIRHLSWPIICIPPGKEYGHGIKKIGFACDFKEVKESTPVSLINEMVTVFEASLHVLNVDYHNKNFHPQTPEETFQLHSLLDDLKPTYHYIDHPDVEDGINEFAEKNNMDLIITIPKKHKLLDGIFKPSSTRQLVFQSHIPIMCVHEDL